MRVDRKIPFSRGAKAKHLSVVVILVAAFSAVSVRADEIRPVARNIALSFFEGMESCVDWLDSRGESLAGFGQWEARQPFPTVESGTGIERGQYSAPLRQGAAVFLSRTSDQLACSGLARWIGLEFGDETFAAWLESERERGRLVVSERPFGDNGSYDYALCLSEPVGLSVWRTSASSWNFSMVLEDGIVPEGVC